MATKRATFGLLLLLFCVILNHAQLAQAAVACGTGGVCSCSETLVSCQSKALTSIPTDIPVTTVSLFLYDNQITSIFSSAFTGLNALIRLDLSNNQITSISANAFTGAISLQVLYLYNNQIPSISASAFTGLTNLTQLSLQNNQITSISSSAFTGLTALTDLSLGSNWLSAIPSSAFTGLTALTHLNLYNNQITTISANAFSGLAALRFLYLNNNQITTFSASAFAGLTALSRLALNANPATTLPPGLFKGLPNLMYLSLGSSNFLQYLSPNNFTFGGNTVAPPSTYGWVFTPYKCDTACATCYAAGSSACCGTDCLTCTSSNPCTQCYEGYLMMGSFCFASAATNASIASVVSDASMQSVASASSASIASDVSATSAISASFASVATASSASIASAASAATQASKASAASVASTQSASVASVASAASAATQASKASVASVASAATQASKASAASVASTQAASSASIASAASASSASIAADVSTTSALSASLASVVAAASSASRASASVASAVSAASALSASVASTASASAASVASSIAQFGAGSQDSSSSAAVIAAVVASVTVIALIVVVFIVLRRRRSQRSVMRPKDSASPVIDQTTIEMTMSPLAHSIESRIEDDGSTSAKLSQKQPESQNAADPMYQEAEEVTISQIPDSIASHNEDDGSTSDQKQQPESQDSADPIYQEADEVTTSLQNHSAGAHDKADIPHAAVGQPQSYQAVPTAPPEEVVDDDASAYVAGSNSRRVREGLTIGKHLASGEFGDVSLGQVPFNVLPTRAQTLLGPTASPTVLVAVKSSKADADEKSRQDFEAEAKLMAPFVHPNVVRLLAALVESEPHLVLLEFVQYGDLRTLLQKSKLYSLWWTHNEQVHAIRQIALGMEYLGTLNFVHRDLAARNCLVGPGMVVKIADFGLSRELSDEQDYYRMQTRGKLPVKWMAPETMTFRKFSSMSDVWSFGVTAWECSSYGAMPYGKMNGAEALAHLEAGGRLPMPEHCSTDLFSLMFSCWNSIPELRPSFTQLVKALRNFEDGTAIREIGALL